MFIVTYALHITQVNQSIKTLKLSFFIYFDLNKQKCLQGHVVAVMFRGVSVL